MKPERVYGYVQIADRIHEELGIRPALSTLRAGAARKGLAVDYPPRITAGMPAPLPPRTHPARFDADVIRNHPWRTQRERLDVLTHTASRDTEGLRRTVADARAAGGSWSAITTALRAGGWPHARTPGPSRRSATSNQLSHAKPSLRASRSGVVPV